MNINEFTKGWIVGDFYPSIINTKEIEVGLKKYKKGDKEEKHCHKLVTEYTIIINGKVRMKDKIFKSDDIVIIEPNIANEFECIEDAVLLVIKTPSIPSDKYIIKE